MYEPITHLRYAIWNDDEQRLRRLGKASTRGSAITLARLIVYAIVMVLMMDWALALAFWLLGWKVPSFYCAAGAMLVLIGVFDCLRRLVTRVGRSK